MKLAHGVLFSTVVTFFAEGSQVLLKVLQIVVKSMFYVFITWHRFAPEVGSKDARLSSRPGGSSGHAGRGA